MKIIPQHFLHASIIAIHFFKEEYKKEILYLIEIYKKSKIIYSKEDEDVIGFYISIIETLHENKIDFKDKNILNTYITKFLEDKRIKDREDIKITIKDLLINREEINDSLLKEALDSIQAMNSWHKLNTTAKTLFGKLNDIKVLPNSTIQNENLKDIEEYIKNNLNNLISHDVSNSKIEEIDFSNKDTISKMRDDEVKRKDNNGFFTGLQGLNRMFYSTGGKIRRGESVLFNALTHNYKSGMLQSMALWFAKYNKTPKINNKKPIILFISLEDESSQNFKWITEKHYREVYKKLPDDIDEKELDKWIFEEFEKMDYRLILLRFKPDEFDYNKLVNLVESYEELGEELHALIIDYLGNMNKGDSSKAANHLMFKSLYNRMCNYTKSKSMTLVTAHQLNRIAQQLVNSGKTNVVKNFNSDHLAESVDVEREVDTSIYTHIELNEMNDIKFLTANRNKRRYDNRTPETCKYFAYPFMGAFGIMDDFNNSPQWEKSIYSPSRTNTLKLIKQLERNKDLND